MKVPDNTLFSLRKFFLSALSGYYEEREIAQLFKLAAESYLKIPFNRPFGSDLRLSESEMLLFFYLIKKLQKYEPIQYALGEAWFCDLKLKVTPAVLIPRPETEELIYWIQTDFEEISNMADLCTGSGCIPLSIKKQYPQAKVLGVELSEAALSVACENARNLNLELTLIQADVLQLSPAVLDEGLDVITSNPPYILKGEAGSLHQNVLDHEPHLALFAPDEDPFLFYRKIAELSMQKLRSGGMVYVEINHLHGYEVKDIFSTAGLTEVTLKCDISERPRMIRGTRP